jgi:hypothetical protein
MPDNGDIIDLVKRNPRLASITSPAPAVKTEDSDSEEECCPAFGFLRGLKSQALAIEFRLRNGNSEWLSYNLLASWKYNPSFGLLLKFTSDLATLVLIQGSNLDAVDKERGVNLTDRGLQRHRILYVREMDEDELRTAPDGVATIDRIDIAEFESPQEVRAWLSKVAPAFIGNR